MPKIKKIIARQIIDSRGQPTIESNLFLDNGLSSKASVPSGASTGSHEALELRDGNKNSFFGKSVFKAISIVNDKLDDILRDINIYDQFKIDKSMIEADATPNKNNFGANSILSVSLACARAASLSSNRPLYQYINELTGHRQIKKEVTPLFNVINGGAHAQQSVSFQEFLLIPQRKKFSEALKAGCEFYHSLKMRLQNAGKNTNVGDEGGFAPSFRENSEVLDFLKKSLAEYDMLMGLDVAATTFFNKGQYKPGFKKLSAENYFQLILGIYRDYNIALIEDPFAEDAWEDWTRLTLKIGLNCRIIGDDLLVTNPQRLNKAIKLQAANGILVKLNQIGTLTETLNVISIAKKANFTVIISHRSGETTDDFISDLAVGVGADYVKFGAPARGERVAKYNRLLAIYDYLQ